MKFKVGDKVRIRQWEDMEKEFGLTSAGNINCTSSFIKAMKHLCGRTAEITRKDEGGRVYLNFDDKSGDTMWTFRTDMIEPAKETIVIYRKGSEVIALDKVTGKKGVAKCNPADKFDFMVGAKLAFERLTEEEKPRRKFKVGDKVIGNKKASMHYGITREGWIGTVTEASGSEYICVAGDGLLSTSGTPVRAECFDLAPELYNGKVVCVEVNEGNKYNYTVGKIYEFKDGEFICDKGIKISNGFKKFTSFEDFKSFTNAKFIEVVE